jgi:hypothetical protein
MKQLAILSSDFPYFIAKNVPVRSDSGSNSAKFRENFGDFRPDTTMKILFSAIVLNNRVAPKVSLKMGFIMVLKFLGKSSTTFPDKDYPWMIGSRILSPYLMSLKLK